MPYQFDDDLEARIESFLSDLEGTPKKKKPEPAKIKPKGDEPAFRQWYDKIAARDGLNPDPDAPEQFYDYRAAFRAGASPDATGHWPSDFKKPGHPNMVVGGFNVQTGARVPGTKRANRDELVKLGWDQNTAAKLAASPEPAKIKPTRVVTVGTPEKERAKVLEASKVLSNLGLLEDKPEAYDPDVAERRVKLGRLAQERERAERAGRFLKPAAASMEAAEEPLLVPAKADSTASVPDTVMSAPVPIQARMSGVTLTKAKLTTPDKKLTGTA